MREKTYDETIDEMIAEQGEVWLSCPDFRNRSEVNNAVVVTDRPDHCFRLFVKDGKWVKLEDKLSIDELEEFFAAFGSHWHIIMNSKVQTSDNVYCKVRSFIKHGRRRSGFSISIETKSVQA